jgi:deoxyribonuclease V
MNLWPKDIVRAREVQDALRTRVKIVPLKKTPEFIAAVDAAFLNDKVIAVAALYKYPELQHLQDTFVKEKTRFPYIPGLLSFREGHAIVSAIKKLKIKPDLILFDGQGIAHPKGIGIASHIGVVLDMPTIGCAKSRLVGEFKEPDKTKGGWTHLDYKGIRVGTVLRTRSNVRPVFVSPGHLIDIESSIEVVMKCVSEYRIPEPLRRADLFSKRLKSVQTV